ncbi:MAG: GyrI-like domain-containing protein [Nocardioidaceae bacterium]
MDIPLVLRESPFTEPTAIEVPSGVGVATLRYEQVSLQDLPSIFDSGFQRLAGGGPIGPGYACYFGDPQGVFDLEIGFPVSGPVTVADAANGAFPSGAALALSHLGGYDGLGAAWGRLMTAYAVSFAGSPRLMVEVYVTDPSRTTPDALRTDLIAFD